MKNLFILLALLFIAGCAGSQKINIERQFSSAQAELIMSADSAKIMRVLSVYNKKDSLLLRTKSEDAIPDSNNAVLQRLIKRMYTTVNDSLTLGVGIAAPQVGILKNIIWVQRYDKPGYPFEVYFNPKITKYTKKKLKWIEGCLSVPGKRDTTTTRSYAILLEYLRPDNTHQIEMIEGFTAIIFQHEIDHLNGILYLDRIK
ncbi:MAG: peptide deformylase [Ignavibacteriaceae bacterium]|nr:peptide deformylase [Ignavibacteriaceae bacterium]